MKNFLFSILTLVVIVACSSNKPAETAETAEDNAVVAFTEARNYFFKNNQEIPADPKITTDEQFAQLFGMATLMGADGKPTEIDFSKQFVVAIVLPATDLATEIKPGELAQHNDSLTYTYTVATGERQSFTTQPVSLIVVDKQYAEMPLLLNCQTDTLTVE